MAPVDLLLAKLQGAKKVGGGWSARCPAHPDRRASLSISIGENGRALVKCHAGCTIEAVVSAVGMAVRDLMPERDGTMPARNGKPATPVLVYPTAAAAVQALEAKLGRRSAEWSYLDAARRTVGMAIRWDRPDGKEIRPLARYPDGWRVGAMPDPRPLYGLPDLVAASRVVVVEGEKAADAARGIGFTATTSAGGAQAAGKTDWSPLAGKEVWILPDNDPSGERYAADVARLCSSAGARAVRVARLADHWPECPPKGDLADALGPDAAGVPWGDAAEPDDIRRAVEEWFASDDPVVPTPRDARPRCEPDVICLADVEPAEVPWVWPSRIPLGRITLLVGRPGAGKSFFTCDLAARLSTGGPWPDGGRAAVGDTLFMCAEDDPADTITPRLMAAGADRRRTHLFRAAKVVSVDGVGTAVAFDLGNVDLIRAALDRLPGCRLVVVDPVGSFLGGRVDAHRDNEVRAVLAPLAALAAERGVAVVLVCHTRKAGVAFADDAALGSRGFVGLARSVLHLAADPDDRDRKLLLPGKTNLGRPAPGLAFRIGDSPTRLVWEAEPVDGLHADIVLAAGGSGDRSQGLGAKRRGPAPVKRDAAADWLADLLRDGPKAVSGIRAEAKAAGLSWRTVHRAREALGVVPRKQSFAGGWEWELLGDQGVHVEQEGFRSLPSDSEPGHLRCGQADNSNGTPAAPEGDQVPDPLAAFGSGAAR